MESAIQTNSNTNSMKKMRLDHFLAECGCGTRSEVKKLIKAGRVKLNGAIAKDPAAKIDPSLDAVICDGELLSYEEFRYFMLNKPQGVVSATRDGISATVLELLEGEDTRDVFPVGRLDKDTEGLLLITNDGQLGHNLLSPRKHVDKTYIAEVSRELTDEAMKSFGEGLDIGDETKTLPARIRRLDAAVYEVIIHEGRYHQVKRMFEALGSKVLFLKRVAMGPLELDPALEPGEYRRLTEEEIQALQTH